MKFMLMMHVPRGTGEYQITSWTPEDFKNHIAFMHQLNKDLTDAGEFVQGEGLTPPGQARLVRAAKDGRPVTDGPFPESKEFLAGFWIIDVANEARAYDLAARISAAPGPGGAPLNMPIEVRPVMSAPPTEL
jgi:hypothetical protein